MLTNFLQIFLSKVRRADARPTYHHPCHRRRRVPPPPSLLTLLLLRPCVNQTTWFPMIMIQATLGSVSYLSHQVGLVRVTMFQIQPEDNSSLGRIAMCHKK